MASENFNTSGIASVRTYRTRLSFCVLVSDAHRSSERRLSRGRWLWGFEEGGHRLILVKLSNFLGIIKENPNVISVSISIHPVEAQTRHFPNIYNYREIKTFQFSFRTYNKGFFCSRWKGFIQKHDLFSSVSCWQPALLRHGAEMATASHRSVLMWEYVSRCYCHFCYCLLSKFLQRTILWYLILFPFSGDYYPSLYHASSTLILQHTCSFSLPLRRNSIFQRTQTWKLLVRRRKLYWYAWRSGDIKKYVVLTEEIMQCTHSVFFLTRSFPFA